MPVRALARAPAQPHPALRLHMAHPSRDARGFEPLAEQRRELLQLLMDTCNLLFHVPHPSPQAVDVFSEPQNH
eukprot:CAMPEP_0173430350 /NCGR_PEP_ID=MMETSP1357-20121228/8805_1 /TAXON_ID=77926 /ORGANISM="Hemiselmis rufescens, Strain PCC563" /LENGTH=72 /DNA_ID=CAMNT_0014394669 /DNA_START=106 /DNA_END=321 /DNA_ORIENTATION=+